MTVASGPDPNAGSRPRRASPYGSAMATTDAIEQLIANDTPTAAATSPSLQIASAKAKKAAPRSAPITSPVASSRAKTERTETPSAIPRMTTVSVCVPTASAM